MNSLLKTLSFSLPIAFALLLSACGEHEHGPNADHSHDDKPQKTVMRPITLPKKADSHDHAQGDHDHAEGDDHEHAPETEAYYGDDAQQSADEAIIIEADEHSHEEGDHDHHY